MNQIDLELYLNTLLEAGRFQDYCPNGLQVQGRPEIRRLATGVTASLALLEAALAWGADAVLVHHGYFWKGEDARITGQKQRRLKLLLAHDLNLFAYHLPLDAHPELGNNAQLAQQLGWIAEGRFGPGDIGWHGRLVAPVPLAQVAAVVSSVLQREPLVLGEPDRLVRRIAWCTGGAQGYFDAAVSLGVDLYVSGEASESTTHLARESGVAYLGAGHHATERYGVQALGRHLAAAHGLEHRFIDIPNPV